MDLSLWIQVIQDTKLRQEMQAIHTRKASLAHSATVTTHCVFSTRLDASWYTLCGGSDFLEAAICIEP
jgi:hypothetical protein